MPVKDPDISYDLNEVLSLAGRVATAIKSSGEKYDGIVAIANGGLAPSMLFSKLTGLPVLDVMRLSRYDSDTKESLIHGTRLLWGPDPKNVRGKAIILGDDVLDYGYSVVDGRSLLYNKMEAFYVRIAVLDFKLGPRKEFFANLKPEYSGRTHEARPWIQYPWEKDGATHAGELNMLVQMGQLDHDEVDRVLDLVARREREALKATAA